MAMPIQPRLGPARITPESFAEQAFRTTADQLDRLPAQYRGAVALSRQTMDDVRAHLGDRRPILEPHDAFLAFSGEDIS